MSIITPNFFVFQLSYHLSPRLRVFHCHFNKSIYYVLATYFVSHTWKTLLPNNTKAQTLINATRTQTIIPTFYPHKILFKLNTRQNTSSKLINGTTPNISLKHTHTHTNCTLQLPIRLPFKHQNPRKNNIVTKQNHTSAQQKRPKSHPLLLQTTPNIKAITLTLKYITNHIIPTNNITWVKIKIPWRKKSKNKAKNP